MIRTRKTELHSDIAIPPGEYLLEVLNEKSMSQAELANRMGRPPQAINEIVKGEKSITSETALQLEQVLGVPAHIWTGLESEYQLVKAIQQESIQVQQEVTLLREIPYKEMAQLGWVKKIRDLKTRVRELRNFFGVASLNNVFKIRTYNPTFRCSTIDKASPYALASWLHKGAIKAGRIQAIPFNKTKLISVLPQIRSLSFESPEEFTSKIQKILSDCGVAFVLLPHLTKTYANGATFWLSQDKSVLMMTIRGSYADIFWFSFFHELGHILLHDKRLTFVDNDNKIEDKSKQEQEANKFAGEQLIPASNLNDFISKGDFSISSIKAFAKNICIPPWIIIGRLQHEGYLKFNQLNNLKVRYKWSDS